MSEEPTTNTEEPSTSTHATASAAIATPVDSKKSENQEQTIARYRSLILTEYGFQATTNENYMNRLQNLRNELNYINETEWMYEPLEKKPPQ